MLGMSSAAMDSAMDREMNSPPFIPMNERIPERKHSQ